MTDTSAPINTWFRIRLTFIFLVFLLFLGLITFRLVQLQVWMDPQLEALAKKQFSRSGKKTAFRLPIVDRNGEELGVSISSGSIYARPRLVSRRKDTARKLAKWLGGEPHTWLEKLRSPKPFVWLQRQAPENVSKEIAKAALPGIFVEPENKRVYPNEELAASVVGFTDIDGNGLAGLELALNDKLLPSDQRFSIMRDGKGTPSYIDRSYVKGDEGGGMLLTTLDRRVQHIVEEELTNILDQHGGKGAYAVVMDPHSGDILALAQRPTFDPNRFGQFPSSMHFNSVVSGLFEPGSTLKPLLAAEAIHLGLLEPSSVLDCGNGEIQIGNKKIREADSHHRFGRLTLRQVIAYSSNVGAIRMAQALGADRVRFAIDKFGLTSRTGILLPAEAATPAKADTFWTPFALASASIGQGISTTPLQMVAAYAPFANGGYWVKPRLLSATEKEIRRRVISFEAAEKMRNILISVSEDEKGTARTARVDGVKIAGKTGTAQKFIEGEGYGGGKYYTSFIGFLPAERPELLIGVMLDEPKKGYYASELAAPLFRRVAERTLAVLNRFPRKEVVTVLRPSTAPPIARKSRPSIEKNPSGLIKMPDLIGLSVSESIHELEKDFSSLQVTGSGYLSSQYPAPGTWVGPNTAIQLNFSPVTAARTQP